MRLLIHQGILAGVVLIFDRPLLAFNSALTPQQIGRFLPTHQVFQAPAFQHFQRRHGRIECALVKAKYPPKRQLFWLFWDNRHLY
ncbi:hypothetical protein QBC39DRAFT_352553 [Podospora conica]|nr:hypothetical protein QBC39DRAFT_352553 [Schizothecium conicum]